MLLKPGWRLSFTSRHGRDDPPIREKNILQTNIKYPERELSLRSQAI